VDWRRRLSRDVSSSQPDRRLQPKFHHVEVRDRLVPADFTFLILILPTAMAAFFRIAE